MAAGPDGRIQDHSSHRQLRDSNSLGHSSLTIKQSSLKQRLQYHLLEDVDPTAALVPLSMFCLMTGFTSAISFSACYIWCGFQTGGTIQLGLAVARLFSGPSPRQYGLEISDRQALVSLISFLAGTSLGRVGDKVGNKRRAWLLLATVIQAGFLLGASLAAFYSREPSVAISRAEPSWVTPLGSVALGFGSASLGLQAIVGKRLGPFFATTVVLTTIWVEVINDPKLFVRRSNPARDQKVLAIVLLFIGGISGRALVNTIGASATLGIGAGMKICIAFSWLLVNSEKVIVPMD